MSSAMDDAFGKRQLRPDHPDFWRLSEIVLRNNGAMDDAVDKETTWRDITGAVIDIESVTYMASQRVIRAFGEPTPETVMLHAKATTLVIEGMVTGIMFAERGGHQE